MTQGSRQNNIPTKDVHTLIPGTCDYITLCGKRDYADMIQLRIFQLRNFPGLFRWAQCNHKGPSKWKEGRRTQRDTVWEGLIHCGRLWRWREMAMSWDRWAAPRSWKKYRNEFTLAMDQTIPMMKPLPAMWWYLETGVVREGGRVRWGLKSGALMMDGIGASERRDTRELSLPAVTQGKKAAICKTGRKPLTRTLLCDTHISDFRSPKPWENKFPLFKPPSLWYFVAAASADKDPLRASGQEGCSQHTFIWAPWNLCQTSDLQTHKIILHLPCLKPLRPY